MYVGQWSWQPFQPEPHPCGHVQETHAYRTDRRRQPRRGRGAVAAAVAARHPPAGGAEPGRRAGHAGARAGGRGDPGHELYRRHHLGRGRRVLFRAIRESHPDLPVILLTAWTHLETAVELVKAGAADYLAKPWDDHKLLATVE